MEVKENDFVLCTVKKIEGTTVFMTLDDSNLTGSIVFSEIAAGRIRNIREYVVPNKKIVCKVLKISKGNIELSFRRVPAKERDFVLDKHKKEATLKSMLKTITKNPESILQKIKEKYETPDFLEQARQDKKIIEQFLNKEESEKLLKILSEKSDKPKEAKKIFILSSTMPSGLSEMKSILETKEAEIHYLGSSKFQISVIAKDFKEANSILDATLQQIEKKAKEKHALFTLK